MGVGVVGGGGVEVRVVEGGGKARVARKTAAVLGWLNGFNAELSPKR